MERMIELVCDCGKKFERRFAEFNRSIKLNRKSFCSRHCQGISNTKNIPEEYSHGNLKNLDSSNRRDEFSPFRDLLKKMRLRESENPNKKVEVTLSDLKRIWENQDGFCPYTGWKLILPESTKAKKVLTPNRASVDRIDSSKGYSVDNIEIVSLMYQFCKNIWDHSSVLEFCKAVVSK